MVVSERVLKWAMRLYPPLLFQRIWVIKFEKDFSGVAVRINKSLFNNNYNGSIFGGTIFAAADPFYPLLFHQLLAHKGYRIKVWMKSAQIQYIKPGLSDLYFKIQINEGDVAEAEMLLTTVGKYTKRHPIEMYNKQGDLCVSVVIEVYLRNLDKIDSEQ